MGSLTFPESGFTLNFNDSLDTNDVYFILGNNIVCYWQDLEDL